MANIKYKHTRESLQAAVLKSNSYSDVLRFLEIPIAGGNHAHIKRQIMKFKIDTSHFQRPIEALRRAAAKRAVETRLSPTAVFNHSREYRAKAKMLTRALLESGVEYKCVDCGIGEKYNNKPLTLEVDHIDENWRNNKKHNLRFLCPNCHSQRK